MKDLPNARLHAFRTAVFAAVGAVAGFAAVAGAQQAPPQTPPAVPAAQQQPAVPVAQQKPKVLEIPANQRPPKGMCRNWIENVPADRQPAVTDCQTAVKNRTPNEHTVYGDDYVQQDAKSTKDPLGPAVQTRPAPAVPISQSTTVPTSTLPPVKPPQPRRHGR